MKDKIRHSGIVEFVDKGCVKIRILQVSACASCKVAGHCNSSDSKEKIVEVYQNNSTLKKGDTVTVAASARVAGNALLYGFGFPFLILVSMLFIMMYLTNSEGVSALSALGALAPYYLTLYLLRDRMRKSIAFEIEN